MWPRGPERGGLAALGSTSRGVRTLARPGPGAAGEKPPQNHTSSVGRPPRPRGCVPPAQGTPRPGASARPGPHLLSGAWTLMASDSCEFSLVPTAFTAFTRKTYCSPGVRPCTTNLGSAGARLPGVPPPAQPRGRPSSGHAQGPPSGSEWPPCAPCIPTCPGSVWT